MTSQYQPQLGDPLFSIEDIKAILTKMDGDFEWYMKTYESEVICVVIAYGDGGSGWVQKTYGRESPRTEQLALQQVLTVIRTGLSMRDLVFNHPTRILVGDCKTLGAIRLDAYSISIAGIPELAAEEFATYIGAMIMRAYHQRITEERDPSRMRALLFGDYMV